MDIEILLTLGGVLLLLGLSAFFSGSETALTAVSRARMHTLGEEGDKNAQIVNRLLASPERIIGTVLLGNNLVNILASALTTSLLISLFGEFGVAYATVAMTLLVVIFAEVLPKTYALAYSDRFSLAVAPIMSVLIVLLRPATIAVEFIVRALLSLTPTTRDDNANFLSGHREIRGHIELQTKEGAVARHDAHMLGGVLDLGDLQVADIMVHRTKMETIDADDDSAEIVADVVKSKHSRLPIWKNEPENIIGVLHTKDLLAELAGADYDVARLDIESLCKEPWFIPDTTSLKEQLSRFLKGQMQMALVVDEYGEVQGLITLEDILEEIVGQIVDEHDPQDMAIRPQTDGTVNVDGSVPIRDLNRQMDWDLPDDEATTVAGLVIHEAQSIPEPGQVFTFYGYRFEVLRKNRNKISALRVKPVNAAGGLRSTATADESS
ncbi:MAG: HlyC/CorC family transporter [Alphaproteobacteria bacterium]|nr:HlyC/CorC family transporter [Alphaproteobacteria bacterium]